MAAATEGLNGVPTSARLSSPLHAALVEHKTHQPLVQQARHQVDLSTLDWPTSHGCRISYLATSPHHGAADTAAVLHPMLVETLAPASSRSTLRHFVQAPPSSVYLPSFTSLGRPSHACFGMAGHGPRRSSGPRPTASTSSRPERLSIPSSPCVAVDLYLRNQLHVLPPRRKLVEPLPCRCMHKCQGLTACMSMWTPPAESQAVSVSCTAPLWGFRATYFYPNPRLFGPVIRRAAALGH